MISRNQSELRTKTEEIQNNMKSSWDEKGSLAFAPSLINIPTHESTLRSSIEYILNQNAYYDPNQPTSPQEIELLMHSIKQLQSENEQLRQFRRPSEEACSTMKSLELQSLDLLSKIQSLEQSNQDYKDTYGKITSKFQELQKKYFAKDAKIKQLKEHNKKLEQEKVKLSQKWFKLSNKNKKDDELKTKIKELEKINQTKDDEIFRMATIGDSYLTSRKSVSF